MGTVKNKVRLKMSSKKMKEINEKCLATVGVPAGGFRKSKPFVKAGKKHHAKRARGKLYPIVRGVAMNPVDHPFGGKGKPGIPKSTSRHAPPGKKVGSIASSRTGRRKK